MPGASASADRWLARGVAVLLIALGFLPVAEWLPGGLVDPAYRRRWVEWAYGIVICAGGGIVASVAARNVPALRALAQHGANTLGAALRASPLFADAAVAALCGITYAILALTVFDARPLLIDELVQVLQARMYASGALSIPTDSAPEFFSVLHMVDIGERFYSQFPPGWPALLAVGSLIRAEWLVGPACGAVGVFLFARLLRRVHGDQAALTVTLGSVLFGMGAFAAFQFSSHMSHGPVTVFILAAMLALTRSLDRASVAGNTRMKWAVAAGLAAGIAFAIRPLDAVAYAVPSSVWLFWSVYRDRTLARVAVGAAIGLAIPVAIVMWVNLQTTGSPTLFGYEALWGAAHGLGFHAAPWGDPHTPQRGIELVSLYVTRLNVYFLESPFPSLVPVIAGLLLARSLHPIEKLLLVATGVHGMLYFAYWHDGFYLGPRFVTPWIPILVMACVRLGRSVLAIRLPARVRDGLIGATVVAVVLTAVSGVPSRIAQYRAGLTSMRTDYGAEAVGSGVTGALVFVRESWGAQLVARLWALGVSRSAAAAFYAKTDACALHLAIGELEAGGVRGAAAEAQLLPVLRDSLLVRASNVSPDTTERMLPGSVYGAECSARVEEDRAGYALYPPFLLDRTSGNVYARDFGARNSELLNRYPERRAYLVRRDGVDGSAPLIWVSIR